MRRIIKLKDGQEIPKGARYLHSSQEHDRDSRYQYWTQDNGNPINHVPVLNWFFGTETLVERTPVKTFHYYEVDDEN